MKNTRNINDIVSLVSLLAQAQAAPGRITRGGGLIVVYSSSEFRMIGPDCSRPLAADLETSARLLADI